MKIWLDDERPMPEGFDTLCKTAEECLEAIKTGRVEYLSFDHDLGSGENGSWLADEIETLAYYGNIKPFDWDVHSANPVGRRVIIACMKSAERFWYSDRKRKW